MAIRDAFLPEFDHEMGTTRKTLERVPENNTDWKPHDKSMTMGRLAGHLVELPTLVPLALQHDSIDFRPPGAPPRQPTVMSTRKQLLEDFDKNVAAARAAIAQSSDEDLKKIFTLQAGGKTIFSLPRTAALRSFILNHIIHHRGQLSVYLRLSNVAVPSIYGPSADEQN
ncbi:MAG TPA: DinB family protein [Candidatus Acidoferrales bacterium]|nr:DinB family protein [Candidatus Acidoferrales bacterium]